MTAMQRSLASLAVMALGIAAYLVERTGSGGLVVLPVLAFLFLGPGSPALFAVPRDLALTAMLVPTVSLAADGIVAGIGVYSGAWSLSTAFDILVVATVLALAAAAAYRLHRGESLVREERLYRDYVILAPARPAVAPDAPPAPRIAVLVPVRDRYEDLMFLLDRLEAQTLPPDEFEVVVVDDGSTDERIRALPGAGRVRVVSLDGAPGAPFSPHLARFAALEATAAPYVACTDVDCRPDPRWLEAGLAALGRSPIVAGRATLSFRRHPTLWSLLDLDTFVDDAHATADGVASTTNLFLDRAVLEQFGGLDARESGGYDLTRRAARAGVQIAYAPDVVVSHAPHYDLGPLLRKVWRVNANAGNTEQPARAPRFGIGLDRALLTDHGLKPSPATRLAALPFVHAVIPAVAAVARLRGAMSRTARRSSRGD